MSFLGLELDSDMVFSATLRKRKEKTEIVQLQTQKVDVKKLYISKEIPIVSGLLAEDIIVKHLALKTTKRREALKTLPYQITANCFLKSEESITLPIIEIKNNLTTTHCYTTTKRLLQNHLQKFQTTLSVDPDKVSCYAAALTRYIQWVDSQVEDSFILHIGLDTCTCVVMLKKYPWIFHTISLGIKHLLETLPIGFQEKDLFSVSQPPIFLKKAEQLRSSIAKTFYSLVKEANLENKQLPLYLTGHGNTSLPLEEFLTTGFLEYYTSVISHLPDKKYAISIGLALDALKSDIQSLQFRQNDFISSKQIRKLGLACFFYLLFSLFLTCSVWGYGKYKNNQLKEHLENLCLMKDCTFTHGSLSDKITHLQNSSLQKNKYLSYTLSVPSVVETIHWLSTHPLLAKKELIEGFQYELLSYPHIDHMQDSYRAKVILQLHFTSSADAKEFLDSLFKKESLANSKEPITWVADTEKYTASFYLKQKKGR